MEVVPRTVVHPRSRLLNCILLLAASLSCIFWSGCNSANPEVSKSEPPNGQATGLKLDKDGDATIEPNKASEVSMRPEVESIASNGTHDATRPGAGSTSSPTPPVFPAPAVVPGTNDSGTGINIGDATNTNGVTIGDAVAARAAMMERVARRPFMQLTLPASDSPRELFGFFADCDRSIADLAIALRTQEIDDVFFLDQARRLGNMKLQAAVRLYNSTTLSAEERKRAIAAQVEALSHLTGSGDIQAARRLQLLATELSTSSDAELAHQGKLVLLGFRLNQLQEGQLKDPQAIVVDIEDLLASSQERGPVEFMALDRCIGVLKSLGYEPQAHQILEKLVRDFSASPNVDLAIRAWNIGTEGSEQRIAFDESVGATINGSQRDPTTVAMTASNLLNRFPSPNSLWYLCQSAINLEFSGNVAAGSAVFTVVDQAWSKIAASPLMTEVNGILQSYSLRMASLGKTVAMDELATIDGQPLDWKSYRGKVVLVCFWSSLNMRCLEEINSLNALHKEIGDNQFAIVSVNLDDPSLKNVEQMVARQQYPWQTVRSSHPTATGFATNAARSIGVSNVPFLMLVNREGVVVAIHLQGEKRVAMIRELLMAK